LLAIKKFITNIFCFSHSDKTPSAKFMTDCGSLEYQSPGEKVGYGICGFWNLEEKNQIGNLIH
jgi:hypothetical protein